MSDIISDTQQTLIDNFLEDEFDYDLDEEDASLSLLRLNSVGSTGLHRELSSPPPFPSHASNAAAALSNSPVKQWSPDHNGVDEPKPKKLFHQRDESDPSLSCYSKIPIPFDPSQIETHSSAVFKRCLSDTYASPFNTANTPYPENFGALLTIDTMPSVSSSLRGRGLSPLPPRPPALLRRCTSDPTPSPSKTLSMSSSSSSMMGSKLIKEGRSKPDKMLMIIKDGARQVTSWCDKLLQYGEDLGFERTVGVAEQKDTSKEVEESKKGFEGGVKAERVSDAFVVQFNCSCGKSYRILFSADECYYKLL